MAAELSRFPGYDVLAKRDTPSWNEATRRALAQRLRTPAQPRFLTAAEYAVADALCRRILPQDEGDEGNAGAVLLVALLDTKLLLDHGGGFRHAGMPYMRQAWRHGLAALDMEARMRHAGQGFSAIDPAAQDALIVAMQRGALAGAHWRGMDAKSFFEHRVLVDVPALYYGHPQAWNEIGFGGPASPRGYVRLQGGLLDPWEAEEAKPDRRQVAERANRHVI